MFWVLDDCVIVTLILVAPSRGGFADGLVLTCFMLAGMLGFIVVW